VAANVKGANGDETLDILRDHDDWAHVQLAFTDARTPIAHRGGSVMGRVISRHVTGALGRLAIAPATPGLSATQPPPAYPGYTPELMEQIRKLVPGGASLTVKGIEEKMHQVRPSTGAPTLVPPRTPATPPSEDAAKAHVLQSNGSELSHVRLRIRSDGTPVAPGRHESRVDLVKLAPQILILGDSGTGRSVTLDFSWTSGLKLSAVIPREPLTGAWGLTQTLAGDVQGVALRDVDGLWLATESRRSGRILKDADLGPFSFRQKRDDLGAPARITDCYRVYFPDVAVSVGTPAPVVVPHGRQRIVRVGATAYLVTILRSEHTELVPCGIASEKAPWVLEYLLRRLDDPQEIRSLENALDTNETPNVPDVRDDPNPRR
jgi:hypothetical protein